MLPVGAGTHFGMSWGIRSTVVPLPSGVRFKVFDDISEESSQCLPERYTKLLIFLLRENSQSFVDITLISVSEVYIALQR